MDIRIAPMDVQQAVVDGLNARKGEWKELAALSGVPYSTLAKVAGGFNKNPRYETVAKLRTALFPKEAA